MSENVYFTFLQLLVKKFLLKLVSICVTIPKIGVGGGVPKGERFQINGFQGLALWVRKNKQTNKIEQHYEQKSSMCFS